MLTVGNHHLLSQATNASVNKEIVALNNIVVICLVIFIDIVICY